MKNMYLTAVLGLLILAGCSNNSDYEGPDTPGSKAEIWATISEPQSRVNGTTPYILSGNVFYMIAIPCAVSNVLGNYIGAGFAIKNGAKIIRPVMICVVTVLIVKIVLGK